MKILICPECDERMYEAADRCPQCGCPARYFEDWSQRVRITLPPLPRFTTIRGNCLVTRVSDRQVLAEIPWGETTDVEIGEAGRFTLRPAKTKPMTLPVILLVAAHLVLLLTLLIPYSILLWPLAIITMVKSTQAMAKYYGKALVWANWTPGEAYAYYWREGQLTAAASHGSGSGGPNIGGAVAESIFDSIFG